MNRVLQQLRELRSWLTTGAAWHWYSLTTVTLCGLLIVALFWLVTSQGLRYFWPGLVQEWVVMPAATAGDAGTVSDGQRVFGRLLETRRVNSPSGETARQYLLQMQTLQNQQPGWRFQWVDDAQILRQTRPRNVLEVSLFTGGRLYGYALALQTGVDQQLDGEQLSGLLRGGGWRDLLRTSGAMPDQPRLLLRLQNGSDFTVDLSDIRYVFYPNDAGVVYRLQQFLRNLWAFLSTGPQPDYQGGILPAIYGTLLLVLLMSIILVPLGVITAVYLHEYAGNTLLARILRVAVSNLAGIPGIVYGVFVLGVFVYGMGAQLDRWFFSDNLPLPTFGTGGLLWASLALALLTLPVVIVATEEGLARIPDSLRRGALALGATRSEMIWGIVVNAASPAILTGLILAIARAAGEVAPLLLVGAVKYTGQPLVENEFPFLHAERQFMHMGYQVYDFALQSANPHASIPLAYATTLILLALVVLLNLIAIRLRARLRRRFLIDYS